MSIVSFREYESIPVVSTLSSSDQRAVSIAELETIDRLGQKLGIQLIQHVTRVIVRTQQFVGSIQMPTRTIEFLPKIDTPTQENLHQVRHNLLEMLLVAHGLWGVTPGLAGLDIRSGGWLDLLIQLFSHALADQVRRGLIKRYRLEEDDLPTVRGQILVAEQLRRNLVHRERTACAYDEFDSNHSLNQLFKLTVRMMLRVTTSIAAQQSLRELFLAFDDVSDVPLTRTWMESIALDRMSERYGFCLALAKLFLSGMTTDLYAGSHQSFALMFDMAQLFELYIGREMQRALQPGEYTVTRQHAAHYLAKDTKSNQRLFRLRPDIVVHSANTPYCIVDTKWKRLQPGERKLGIAEGDLYQMFAYAERYQCGSILLLYPWNYSAGEFKGIQKKVQFEGKESHLTVGEVALHDLTAVREQLKVLFNSCQIAVT